MILRDQAFGNVYSYSLEEWDLNTLIISTVENILRKGFNDEIDKSAHFYYASMNFDDLSKGWWNNCMF